MGTMGCYGTSELLTTGEAEERKEGGGGVGKKRMERESKSRDHLRAASSVDGVGSGGRKQAVVESLWRGMLLDGGWRRLACEWQTCGWLFLQAGREEAVVAVPVA